MGRSVMTHRNAIATVYLGSDWNDSEDWDDDVQYYFDTIHTYFKSFRQTTRWEGNEMLVIAQNEHVFVTVSEYCGLVAICLVPHEGRTLAEPWCRRVASSFERLFSSRLKLIGRASNGECFYE